MWTTRTERVRGEGADSSAHVETYPHCVAGRSDEETTVCCEHDVLACSIARHRAAAAAIAAAATATAAAAAAAAAERISYRHILVSAA